ncbi:MAG TPA: hypothetical protein VN934_04220 [Candidatus Tumulicola sp.]|nr:hypothetical protein [Candidatus Tumulicola sp.]
MRPSFVKRLTTCIALASFLVVAAISGASSDEGDAAAHAAKAKDAASAAAIHAGIADQYSDLLSEAAKKCDYERFKSLLREYKLAEDNTEKGASDAQNELSKADSAAGTAEIGAKLQKALKTLGGAKRTVEAAWVLFELCPKEKLSGVTPDDIKKDKTRFYATPTPAPTPTVTPAPTPTPTGTVRARLPDWRDVAGWTKLEPTVEASTGSGPPPSLPPPTVPLPKLEDLPGFKLDRPRQNGGTSNTQGAVLAPFAGPRAQIVFYIDPNPPEGGAQGVLLLSEDEQGQKRYFRATPDAAGKVALIAELHHSALKALSLVTRIDAAGRPEIGSRCEIGNPGHIPGTDIVAHPPAHGLRITETNSAAQAGDIVNVHIANNTPLDTRFTLDGKPVRILGVSDNSAVLWIARGTPLMAHHLVMESAAKRSNAVPLWVVQLAPEPVGSSRPGIVQTITIHVNGLAPDQQAKMDFEISGAALMLDGSSSATEPVENGIVRLQVRGTQTGRALLRFHLKMLSAQFL